ncbi:MAG: sigma-70 family RNA polymerase sigma factor [Betaproteobacteria bacterium]|nr:sigma-70 family RNA polymerase sigma factor [Betaproteobacteria bacterium]
MTSQTIFIVDDDDAARESLAMLLQLKGFGTQTFASAEEFLERYRPEWPGCVVLDLRMTGMSGIELQAELTRRGLQLPIIFVTAHGDVPSARAALKAGAIDFVEKPIDHEALLAAIASALDRDAQEREQLAMSTDLNSRLSRLTAREREVLDLVAEGKHSREIASLLGISPRTVEVYRSRLMEKLQVRRIPELVKLVLEAAAPPSRPRD